MGERVPIAGGAALTALLALALYAASISENLGASHDSVQYLNRIDSGERLFHQHHLLFAPLAHLWLLVCRVLGSEADSARLVPLVNAAAGAATLALFYTILRRRLGCDAALAGLGTALPAFSFGLWFYSACVEVYVVPLLMLAAALYALTSDAPARRAFAAAGAAHGLAVLFHQVHVLFLGVALVAALRRGGERRAALLAYAGAFAPLAAGGYLAVMLGVEGVDSIPAAWDYLTGYAREPLNWSAPSLATPLSAALGAARSLVGAHFVFAVPELRDSVLGALPGQELGDEAYLVREVGAGAARVLLAGGLGVLAGVAVAAAAGARRLAALEGPARLTAELAAVWLAVYAAFFCFWVPHNVEFWIPQSLAFWLLFVAASAVRLRAGAPRRRLLAAHALLAVALATVNLAGSIVYLKDRSHDYHYALVAPFVERAAPDDLVVVGRKWILEAYAVRFTRARVLSLAAVHRRSGDAAALARLARADIDATLARGRAVFISWEAVDVDPNTARELGPAALDALDALWRGYRDAWQVIPAETGPVYVLGERRSTPRRSGTRGGSRGARSSEARERCRCGR